jgi:hypothetical protein
MRTLAQLREVQAGRHQSATTIQSFWRTVEAKRRRSELEMELEIDRIDSCSNVACARLFSAFSPRSRRKVVPPKRDKERFKKTRQWANQESKVSPPSMDDERETYLLDARAEYSRNVAAEGIRRGVACVEAYKDLYTVLGAPHTATAKDIKKAFARMALRVHPDRAGESNATAAREWPAIVEAYGVLKDPVSKARYDHEMPIYSAVHQFYSDCNPLFATYIKVRDGIAGCRETYSEADYVGTLFEKLQTKYKVERYAPFERALQQLAEQASSKSGPNNETRIVEWDLTVETGPVPSASDSR